MQKRSLNDDGGFAVPSLPLKRVKSTAVNADNQSQNSQEWTAMNSFKQQLWKAFTKNQQQRLLHPTEPIKFMDSEAELSGALDTALSLASYPHLYPTLLTSTTGSSSATSSTSFIHLLEQLLIHENSDIVIQTIRLIQEMTDEDSMDTSGNEGMLALMNALIQSGIVKLLIEIMQRLDEVKDEDDARGVFSVLSVIENIVSFDSLLCTHLHQHTNLLSYLVHRLTFSNNINADQQQSHFSTPISDANRFYAAEILAIFVQSSPECVRACLAGLDTNQDADAKPTNDADHNQPSSSSVLTYTPPPPPILTTTTSEPATTSTTSSTSLNTPEILLHLLSMYKKSDPSSTDEEEFLHNCFDVLCALMGGGDPGRWAFLNGEGVELMLRMIREKKMSSIGAWKTLAFAMSSLNQSSSATRALCARFIDRGGLKYLASHIMRKPTKQLKKSYPDQFQPTLHDERLLSILSSLYRHLTADPPQFHLLRVGRKLGEAGAKVVERLAEMFCENAMGRLAIPYSEETEHVSIKDEEYILDQMETNPSLLTQQYALTLILCEILFRSPLYMSSLSGDTMNANEGEDEKDGDGGAMMTDLAGFLAKSLARRGVNILDDQQEDTKGKGKLQQQQQQPSISVMQWLESYLRVLSMEIRDYEEEKAEETTDGDEKMDGWLDEIRYCQRFYVLSAKNNNQQQQQQHREHIK